MASIEEMKLTAKELRLSIVNMIHKAGSGHTGGSLSIVEILTVLYGAIMNIRPKEPYWPDRDRLVLSKGHGAPALYAILAKTGFFDPGQLNTLRQLNSCLQGHPCMFKLPGIDMSTGSLGMGISVGVGMALSAKRLNKNFRVFVICGDGELQEGQNWEAMMSIAKWELDNMVLIVDRNGVQLDGKEKEIMPMGDVEAKIKSFGLHVLNCNGHSIDSVEKALKEALSLKKPVAIIAETVKGKGVSFMEGQSIWHGKPIGKEEYEKAIRELEEAKL